LHAAVVRRRLGELQGGTDGQRLIAQSDTLMRERGVVNVDATARVYGVG
jgi:hypothetical protein